MNFSKLGHYIDWLINKIAALPAKDYPPANIAAWIKICGEKGRGDLGKKIMTQWNAVVDKYPAVRVSWPAATKIAANSIKKNVFAHKEFMHWLESELDVPHAEAEQLERSVPAPPRAAHPIEVPGDEETPEQWASAADKTKHLLSQVDQAFGSADELLAYLKTEASGLEGKIEKYGPGGAKSKNKDGTPSKLSDRVPKWREQLKQYEAKVTEVEALVKKEKSKVQALDSQYNAKRITTVQYEEGVQSALQDTLQFILREVKDPEKQKSMLVDLQKLMKKVESEGGERAASLKNAGFWDKFIGAFTSVFEYVKSSWESLVAWAKGLTGKVDALDSAINPF